MARDQRSLGDLPVTVVTADGGQSDKRDQQVWKVLSSDFSQVVLSGGHDIYVDDPQGVVQQILNTVDRIGWTRPAANAPTSTQRRRSWRPKL